MTDVRFINAKSKQQQELQMLTRLHQLTIKQKVAMGNQLCALLLEFNIRVKPCQSGLNSGMQAVLDDAENGFSAPFREALNIAWKQYLDNIDLND